MLVYAWSKNYSTYQPPGTLKDLGLSPIEGVTWIFETCESELLAVEV